MIGLQFRMKGLNKGEPKSIKQLRMDGEALMQEHQGYVLATEDTDQVNQLAELLFRTFQISEKGHAMAQ